MPEPTAAESLKLAQDHLERALAAATEPVDWTDLSTYGFYCLEAAVMAASGHLKLGVQRSHPGKVGAAKLLANKHKLPDVSALLVELNTARKAHAYGDVEAPDLDEEELASDLDAFVDAVKALIKK